MYSTDESPDEENKRYQAILQIQRVVRGHQSRSLSINRPIWPNLPSPIRGIHGYDYSEQIFVRSYDFKDHLCRLETILTDGISYQQIKSIPDLLSFWRLMQFTALLAFAYLNKCMRAPAAFLWSAITNSCSDDLLAKIKEGRNHDTDIVHSLEVLRMIALSGESYHLYRTGQNENALSVLKQAVKLCGTKEQVFRFVMKCQQGIMETVTGKASKAVKIFETVSKETKIYVEEHSGAPNSTSYVKFEKERTGHLSSDIVNVGILDWKRVCGHLSVICRHNMAVAYSKLGRWKEVQKSARDALSMSGLIHSAQPVKRHLLHSYVSSLKRGPFNSRLMSTAANFLSQISPSACDESLQRDNGYHPLEGSLRPWRTWLAMVAESVSFGPAWISMTTLDEMQDFVTLDKDTAGLAELLGPYSPLFIESQEIFESRDAPTAKSWFAAAENSLKHLASKNWRAAVYILNTVATVLFCNCEFAETKAIVERTIDVCMTRKTESVCKLQLSACLFRLDSYEQSFKLAKEVLETHKLELTDLFGRDVLVVSCQIMALLHIFYGEQKYALKCAKIAVESLGISSFGALKSNDYDSIIRTYNVALSMNQISKTCLVEHKSSLKNYSKTLAKRWSPQSDTHAKVPSILLKCSLLRSPHKMSIPVLPNLDRFQCAAKKYLWTGCRSLYDGASRETFISAAGRNVPVTVKYQPQIQKNFVGGNRLVNTGIDTTRSLRQLTRSWSSAAFSVHQDEKVKKRVLPICSTIQTPSPVMMEHRRQSSVLRIDMNSLRTGKHFPLRLALKESQLGKFLSASHRKELLDGMQSMLNASVDLVQV